MAGLSPLVVQRLLMKLSLALANGLAVCLLPMA